MDNMTQEDLLNLASRKSLFYPAAEIYAGSPSGFWEYGPLGSRIRNHIAQFWRDEFVHKEGFVEIFGSQTLPESVFRASGHLENFNDPIIKCQKCETVQRADKLIEEHVAKTKQEVEPIAENMSTTKMDDIIKKLGIKCPKCGANQFGLVSKFNMMMKLDIGATGNQTAYLRPETCQSIFCDFDRVWKTSRGKLPLGIAQMGTAFRNEISPRNGLLRSRELEQMEIEIFFNPKKSNEVENWDEVKNYPLNIQLDGKNQVEPVSGEHAIQKKIISSRLIAYYLARWQQWVVKLGVPLENIRFRQLSAEEKAFYALESFDLEIKTSAGWIEITACNNRTDYDLKRHAAESKKELSVKEEGETEKFVPHNFELSAGLGRILMVLLELNLKKEKRGNEEQWYLDLHPQIAPYLFAVFPLVKKDGLSEKSKAIFDEVSSWGLMGLWDEAGSIGKRYARCDEVGIPYCITIDYDTMQDGTVTIRDRNSLGQKRVKVTELAEMLLRLKLGKEAF